MKTAVYMVDGTVQVVLTPENDFEKFACKFAADKKAQIRTGSFYECNGGYFRHGPNEESLIVILEKGE